MVLKLLVRSAYNLPLRSHRGVTSKFKDATFEVGAALTDGQGVPLTDDDNAAEDDDDGKNDSRSKLERLSDKLNVSATWSVGWAGTGHVRASPDPSDSRRGSASWDEGLDVGGGEDSSVDVDVLPDTYVEIALRRDFGKLYPSHEVGRTRTTVRELSEMDDDGGGVELMMFDLNWLDNDGDVVAGGDDALPTVVRVSVVRESLPEGLRATAAINRTDEELRAPYARRLMMVTRGTRGDIQPFLALARGLAEMRNWEVVIVTEMEYKAKMRSQQDVEAGAIRFRPSGGDTMKRVQSQISQKAINLKLNAKQTNVMQKIFLARSEIEFFPSEPAVFHWAQKMRPDVLMFGFTMASVTLIASEALGIPVIGFVLQPTSIPSSRYPPVLPLTEERFKTLTVESIAKKHHHFKMLKYAMENLGGSRNKTSLASLRERRGLEPYKSYRTSTWQELKDKNFPLVVPINETMFGGKPADWSENSVFTDCIFLRGDSVPQLADDVTAFIQEAKAMGGKIVVLAFSSMPVSKSTIVSIALKLVRKCRNKACVFALVGGQIDLPLDGSVAAEAQRAQSDHRLFIASGAPFGRLFPLVDCVVLHGGLGTTSETLQAKVPAIVTGVLLLDQRFWGSRMAQLNVGPFGTHIDDFPDSCVEHVDGALEEDSVWRKNAARLGHVMTKEAGDDPSGVRKNVEAVVRMSGEGVACPYFYSRADDKSDQPFDGNNSSSQGIRGLESSLNKSEEIYGGEPDGFGFDEVYIGQV